MKLEKLDYNGSKGYKMFLYGLFVGVLLLVIIGLLTSKAKYKQVDKVNLINQRIQYTGVDLEIVEIKVDGEDSTIIPTGNYDLTEESYCTEKNDNFEDETNNSIQLSYDSSTKAISVTPYTNRGTKCHIFLVKGIEPSEKTLKVLGFESQGERTTFTGAACAGTTENADDCKDKINNGHVYSAPDDYGTSYYFRGSGGDTEKNWVKFGKTSDNKDMYWRIIRINGNGTIRLLYNGTTNAQKGGETTYSSARPFNSSYRDNKYVGFMFGNQSDSYENAHKNENKSTILESLELFYDRNLMQYADILDGATGFCGDREKVSGDGYGSSKTYYGPWGRLFDENNSARSSQKPILTCPNKIRDLYTTKDNPGEGNGALDYPVGLITSDEVVFAGGFGSANNKEYWLYNERDYWTMSPADVNFYYTYPSNVFKVYNIGALSSSNVQNSNEIRPVINLKANVQFESGGDGTAGKPFVVKLN